MATKFYLNNATTFFTPTVKGAWDGVTGNVVALGTEKFGNAITSTGLSEISSLNPNSNLVIRGISSKLQPQTISGTLNLILGVLEGTNADADFFWQIYAYVTQGDTDLVRGVLINNYTESSNEWASGFNGVGIGLVAPVVLSSVPVLSGDRIVLELGYISRNIVTASRIGTIWFGTQVGGNNAPDLVVGEANVTIKAGTITFSQDITFEPVTPEISHLISQVAIDAVPSTAEIGHISTQVVYDIVSATAEIAHIVIQVVKGRIPIVVPGIELSGIYTIEPTKVPRHDSYYGNNEKKIPNPTIKTALLGE